MNIDLSEIRELLAILNQTDVTELTLEAEGFRLSIRKDGGKAKVQTSAAPEPAPTEPAPPPPTVAPSTRKAVDVVAPMVGTFYRAPSPDAANFVEIGDDVKVGQTVCIIEAMKLMNGIDSEVSGRVIEILVDNGEPIEFGQKLMRLEPL